MRMLADCAPCRRAGHLCPAALMSTKFEGEGEEPMCLECADDEVCLYRRFERLGREESSVTPRLDESGAIEFPSEQGAVVRRTPEELGIATAVVSDQRSVVSDRKPQGLLSYTPDPEWRKKVEQKNPVTIGSKRKSSPRPVRAVKKEETREMPTGKYGFKTPDDVRAQILAEPAGARVSELAKKYTVKTSTIYYIRKQAGVRTAAILQPRPPKAAKPSPPLRPVEIDLERPGNASSMMQALAKIDAAAGVIKIEMDLTQAEIGKFIGSLDAAERAAFLNAGMRAVLFA